MKGIGLKICIFGILWLLVLSDECSKIICKNGECIKSRHGITECRCYHGWKGSTCNQNIDDCNSDSCLNGGKCIDQKNSRYICNCTTDFIGDKCQFKNVCSKANPCKNGGKCEIFEDGSYQCKCRKRFSGKICENESVKCPVNQIESREICSNHGNCQLDENEDLYCKCYPGYAGKFCDRLLNHGVEIGCNVGYCANNGKCQKSENGSPFCVCPKGFSGNRCNNKLNEIPKNSPISSRIMENIKETGVTMKYKTSECDGKCKPLKRNGICDKHCNIKECEFDGGDCDPWKRCTSNGSENCREVFNDGKCDPECNSVDCLFDGEDCLRTICPYRKKCTKVYQNGICDEECNNPECGFDGGDCRTIRQNSFFNSDGTGQCSSHTKMFELDLILMTSMNNFTKRRSEFLQKLSSSLRMVVTIANVSEINFNHETALLIKLYVNHTQCILYGGQCFGSLDQISNFLNASIDGRNALSLPFKVAKVDTRIISRELPKSDISLSPILLIIVIFGAIFGVVLLSVLMRDKWGKLRTKIKSTGIWTPSDGYSTSTSSINSGHKSDLMKSVHMGDFNKDGITQKKFLYPNINYKTEHKGNNHVENDLNKNSHINSRKRKYETSNKSDTALSFQLISEALESRDGIHPIDSYVTDVNDILNDKIRMKYKENIQNASDEGLGDYVNDKGESLLHIAARMNSGPNIIKQLNSLSPSMLNSLDEWGRTPLASAVNADSVESIEQLILIEKQLRKESKQTKSRSGINNFNSGSQCEYFIKKTTALIEAVKLNSKEIINLLLEEGNPVNVLDSYGRSVVHWSAIFNNVALLERLSHMKIFQKLADYKDNEDKSPLYLAANEGHIQSVKFLLEYFNKTSIKVDPNSPCPKQIAEEKGFLEIRDLISEALRKATHIEKNDKRLKLKEPKIRHKLNSFEKPMSNLCMIDEFKELSANSIENFPNSPNGNESIDSCLLELYSITDHLAQNIQQHLPNEKSSYSSFKPIDHRYQEYQSNTSSSDMSPPLLNLNNTHFQNGFNSLTYSDQVDSNLSNSMFMSPKSFITQPDQGNNPINQLNPTDFPAEFYGYQSPTLPECKHRPINVSNFSSLNCLL